MTSGPSSVSADWYAHSFGALYPILYAHRTAEAAAPEAAFAAGQLGLTRADALLDLCCGNGRHLIHLRKHAPRAVGLDYSPELLALARESVGDAALLVRGDMRALPFHNTFDVVTSFFTSFGYFFSEEENLAVVRNVAQSLKPGGRFFIDYLNPAHVARTLVPQSRRIEGHYTFDENRWIDEQAKRVNKTTIVTRAGQAVCKLSESVRLYSPSEMQSLLNAGGLAVSALFGNHDGAPFRDDLPRMIILGKRS